MFGVNSYLLVILTFGIEIYPDLDLGHFTEQASISCEYQETA